ncbi:hypothetical protein L0657_06705 [Dyadobacter sp. CY345]|uniref:hypothetical protein n=1 Tax=Dyadobacter sp. CY345 TaxID=2909335 RepID=UPI001F4617FF|nr:hypothetical protein [Dyadobacter sp. CY345]MCF2443640.1 hypothetical protein [Dyadobacter sp. CY345]
MKDLYYQLSDAFKAEWPDKENGSGVDHNDRLFHKFLLQRSPKRAIKLELSDIGLRASYHIQGTGAFDNYMSGSPDIFPSVLIEKSDDDKYTINTITGKTMEVDCFECLQPVIIDQMKQSILMGVNH